MMHHIRFHRISQNAYKTRSSSAFSAGFDTTVGFSTMAIIRTMKGEVSADVLESSTQPDPLEALIARIEGG
jgi:hypothetical protein